MRRLALSTLLLPVFALSIITSHAQSVQVLQRARLGNNTEDITYIRNGPLTGNIAILDGYETLGVLSSCSPCIPPHKLFDVRRLGVHAAPPGIAYIESARFFALTDPTQPTKLFLSDDDGQPRGTRTIQYINGFAPNYLEGLAYIPKTSPSFPDDLLQVAIVLTQGSRIEVLRRDGQVVQDIIPADPLSTSYITGVSYLAPGRILLTTDNNIWVIDFAGNILAGPITLDEAQDIEGIVQLGDSDIVAADYQAGKLFFFDKNLNRLPDKDRDYKIGVGVTGQFGVAWNSDTNQHLVTGAVQYDPQVVSVPSTLDSATQVLDLQANGFDPRMKLTYLPDEHLIAGVNRASPQTIVLFDNNGNIVQEIDVSAFGDPNSIAYIPTTKQFAMHFSGDSGLVRIFDRTGNEVRTIDFSRAGVGGINGLTFFDPDPSKPGQFLFVAFDLSSAYAEVGVVADLEGNLVSRFDLRTAFGFLDARDVSTITTGPQAGAFAMVDHGNSEIVIFRLQ